MSATRIERLDGTAFEPRLLFDFDGIADGSTSRLSTSSPLAKQGKLGLGALHDSSSYSSYPSDQQLGISSDRGNLAPFAPPNADASVCNTMFAGQSGHGPQLAHGMQWYGSTDENLAVHDQAGLGSNGLDKSQRARNAANQRYSKKMRKDSKSDDDPRIDDDDVGGGEGAGKKDRYREKNRQAAAKCRDKKKRNTEQLDHRYRLVAADNAAIKHEVRLLRDEFCRIRELALQHGPEQCGCSALHDFNMQQAVKEATSMARMMGSGPMMNSPDDDQSPSNTTSSESAGNSAGAHSFPDPALGYDFTAADMAYP